LLDLIQVWPEGPKSEARGAKSGWGVGWGGGFLGRGSQSLPHQLGVMGERCQLPQRGPWQSPGRQTVFTRFKCSEWPLHAVYCLVLLIVPCFTQENFVKARAMNVSVASMNATALRCIGLDLCISTA